MTTKLRDQIPLLRKGVYFVEKLHIRRFRSWINHGDGSFERTLFVVGIIALAYILGQIFHPACPASIWQMLEKGEGIPSTLEYRNYCTVGVDANADLRVRGHYRQYTLYLQSWEEDKEPTRFERGSTLLTTPITLDDTTLTTPTAMEIGVLYTVNCYNYYETLSADDVTYPTYNSAVWNFTNRIDCEVVRISRK